MLDILPKIIPSSCAKCRYFRKPASQVNDGKCIFYSRNVSANDKCFGIEIKKKRKQTQLPQEEAQVPPEEIPTAEMHEEMTQEQPETEDPPESNNNLNNDSREVPLMIGNKVKSITLTTKLPFLTAIFYILAALGLLGGFFMGNQLWPGDPGYNREWKMLAYTPSIMWIAAGIIECALFAAIGNALYYLKGIYENTQNHWNSNN